MLRPRSKVKGKIEAKSSFHSLESRALAIFKGICGSQWTASPGAWKGQTRETGRVLPHLTFRSQNSH